MDLSKAKFNFMMEVEPLHARHAGGTEVDANSGKVGLDSTEIPGISETCTVVVISGRLSDRESHAQVHVIVTDENDNAPELVYPEEPRVCENAAPGKVRQEEEFLP